MESVLALEARIHYREMDKASGPWDGVRVRRLCNLMNITQEEFAALIRIRPHQLKSYCFSGKWPGCLKLLLELIERSAHRSYLGKHYKTSLFPTGTL